MGRMRISPLLILLAGAACDRPADPAPATPEPPEVVAFREEVAALLRSARSLTFVSWSPIPDGGSKVIALRTEAGKDLDLQALHQNPDMGGFTTYQAFLFYKQGVEFHLARGSALEERLLELLETATAAPSNSAALDSLKTSLKRRTPYRPK